MPRVFQNTQPVNKVSLSVDLFMQNVVQNTHVIKVSLFLESQTITHTLF